MFLFILSTIIQLHCPAKKKIVLFSVWGDYYLRIRETNNPKKKECSNFWYNKIFILIMPNINYRFANSVFSLVFILVLVEFMKIQLKAYRFVVFWSLSGQWLMKHLYIYSSNNPEAFLHSSDPDFSVPLLKCLDGMFRHARYWQFHN